MRQKNRRVGWWDLRAKHSQPTLSVGSLVGTTPPTALDDRDRLRGAMRHALASRTGCGMVLCRTLGMPHVRETFGTEACAVLLASVARRLLEHLGPGGFVDDLGDGAFVLLLPAAVTSEVLLETTRGLLDRMTEPYDLNGSEVVVHCVAGVLVANHGNLSEAYEHVELASYEARHRGPGNVVAYSAALADRASQWVRLTSGVGQAARRGELSVHYQQINDIATGDIVGAEALLRWTHPEMGPVSPATFIPIAEQSQAILSIGRHVLEEACRQLATWQASPDRRRWHMHVNISARQIEDIGFPALVREVVERTGVVASSLTLELTETGLMHDTESTREAFDALKAVGVRLAIDDFGVGYSSLSYLTRLPVDVVKIDRSFIGGLGVSAVAGEVVRSITDMAHRLGLEVVAEGIETEAQRIEAARLGCVFGQGFYFGTLGVPAAERVLALGGS
jgi:EAL domain-containing protein (putative c-di-GMP-specific phosphodiesterase class I)/GGDEF domain-containing protein